MKKFILTTFLLFFATTSLLATNINNTETEEFGYLSVISKPFTNIKIDGKILGQKIPLIKHKLPVGKHTIHLYDKSKGISDTFIVIIRKNKVKPIIKDYLKGKRKHVAKKHKRSESTREFNRNQKEVPIKNNSNYGYLSLITRPSTDIKIKVGSMISKYKSPIVKLKLPTGIHRIWLNNESREIKDTFKVKIEKGKVKPIIKKYEKK